VRTPIIFRHSPLTLVRKALTRSAYTLRTGYWHTGERCCPDFPDENFVNHFKVYRFASQFCGARTVLDVGCGTGYGTSYLAESAKKAVGIDLSRQALRYARTHYRSSKLEFLRMSAESLEFADRTFDLVLSTENFEHLHDQRANLRQMSRVLTDAGMLLLATPNPEMFVSIRNHYHTHEFVYDELVQILGEEFGEFWVCENQLSPPTEECRHMREDRERRGAVGINLSLDCSLWGERIDTSYLSNTHSFFCFARKPRHH
jgi:2-polyprenyl-3-methyl-5-hydroxy-6-metoxy-1,4-benzoquinol methylase